MAYNVPEAAIRNFEQIQNVRVTVHDIAGTIHMFLPPDRAMHTLPQCSAVKASGGQPSCMALEVYNCGPWRAVFRTAAFTCAMLDWSNGLFPRSWKWTRVDHLRRSPQTRTQFRPRLCAKANPLGSLAVARHFVAASDGRAGRSRTCHGAFPTASRATDCMATAYGHAGAPRKFTGHAW